MGISKKNLEPELASLSEEGGAVTAGTVGRPPATQQSKVSFAEGTTFERERTSKFQCLSFLT